MPAWFVTPRPSTPYLELRAVDAWLGPRLVFRNLNLTLHQGEHTVVLGPNGAGKSALIKLLSRELYPVVQAGSSLRIFGEERVNLWDLRRRIGLVSQDLQAWVAGVVTGADLVLSGFFGSNGLGPSQQPTTHQRLRVQQLLEELGLEALAQRPYAQLSDGQRRRLLLARALVHNPEVLVLDEPTNGLDLRARHQLLALMRHLAQRGTTLLLVTHQIDTIVPEISRALLLQQGQLIADGPVATLLQAGPLSQLFSTPLEVVRSADGYHQVFPAAQPHPPRP